jgi:hypothetical protein
MNTITFMQNKVKFKSCFVKVIFKNDIIQLIKELEDVEMQLQDRNRNREIIKPVYNLTSL